MTTTVNVSKKGEIELPEAFRKRNQIKVGTALRAIEVGEGLFLTAVPEPTEQELRKAIEAAGSLSHRQTRDEDEMVNSVIAEYRNQKRRRR